ncbi:MAG: hypothetical protein MK135_15970, partial [Polyangiaceae bacterium]|nr:hypothetical protein [Polyangiaceae bacterium]
MNQPPNQKSQFLQWAAFTTTLILGYGCKSALDVPDGPNLSALRATYDSPPGIIAEDILEEVTSAAQDARREVENLTSLEFFLESIATSTEDLTNLSKDLSRNVDLRGISDVVSTCPGVEEDSEFSFDERRTRNGTIDYALLFEDSQLKPSIRSRFSSCQFFHQEAPVQTEGVVLIGFRGDLNLRNLEIKSFLFDMAFDYTYLEPENTTPLDSEDTNYQIDFEYYLDGTLDIGVPAQGGDVIFRFGVDFDQAGLRTADGSF